MEYIVVIIDDDNLKEIMCLFLGYNCKFCRDFSFCISDLVGNLVFLRISRFMALFVGLFWG